VQIKLRGLIPSLLAAVAWATLSSAPVFADQQGWVLTQKSTRLGDQYLYVSPEGLKLVNPKLGFNIVTRGPDWNIIIFNEQTHNYYQTTSEAWKHQIVARSGSTTFSGANWQKSGETKIAGMNSVSYRMNGTLRKYDAHGNSSPSKVTGSNYWVSSEIKVPARLIDLLATAYGLPPSTSVPLRLTYNEDGGERTMLDTYRIDKAPIPVAYFAKPAGYKRVNSDAEVMMSTDQAKMMQDMASSLGSGAPDSASLQKAVSAYSATGNAKDAVKGLPANWRPKEDDIKAALEAYKRQMGK
jgi:hypothetical protein